MTTGISVSKAPKSTKSMMPTNVTASLEHEKERSMNGEGFDLEPSEESGSVKSGKGVNDDKEVIAQGETKAVGRLKFVVMLVLVTSAIAVAFSVNSYIREKEQDLFEEEFRDDGLKVLESVGVTFEKTLRAFDNVAVTFVTIAAATNQTWPFVTIPNFAELMTTVLELSHAIHVDFIPLVVPELLDQWEDYSFTHKSWINDAMTVQEIYDGYYGPIIYNADYEKRVHDGDGTILTKASNAVFPVWQNFPVVPNETYTYNFDFSILFDLKERDALIDKHEAIISKPSMIPMPGDVAGEKEAAYLAEEAKHYISKDEEPMEPMSDVFYPILDKKRRTTTLMLDSEHGSEDVLVGILSTAIYWRSMIRNILPFGSNGVHVVIHNTCTQPFTYEINGPEVVYLGVGDLHDTKYEYLTQKKRLIDLETETTPVDEDFDHAQLEDNYCTTTLYVYPSDTTRDTYTTNNAVVFTVAVAGIFLFTILVFYVYDLMVERRQKTVMDTATRSSAIVSSLFPSSVRHRLYTQESKPVSKASKLEAFIPATAKGKLQNFLGDGKAVEESGSTLGGNGLFAGGPPIAELYPESTVLFADIAGFTAWSSVRQPVQVFHLLESVYSAFDEIARRRGVFKVETVGDSYVAVVGLPTPRKHHAVVMAIFAHECRIKMNTLTRELEKSLGPGTADLAMRFGLNSGPTTAGVLRGEKSRFQLFGDTVNTAARMESNGERNRIQVSQKTADLIKASGRSHWLTARVDEIHCKGKGLMKTYWCEPKSGSGSIASSDVGMVEKEIDLPSSSTESSEVNQTRLIDWNVDLFTGLLEEIMTQRSTGKSNSRTRNFATTVFGQPLDEVTDVLAFPVPVKVLKQLDGQCQISTAASEQLRELVTTIAGMYGDNPFHNFDHCSHVVMSTKKLLDRIADCEGNAVDDCLDKDRSSTVITSNPLTHFAIIFAALVHDIDHSGVSNAQLIKENHATAIAYAGKSVAEQNSVDTAWSLIMQPKFAELRTCIYTTEKEQKQFRSVLVNVVMATDLFDGDLKAMRQARWCKSFDETPSLASKRHLLDDDDTNRRATIILELIIQASDVSHTMQHFTIYQKWNMCLLTEMHHAFLSGRTDKNPLDGWYEGELWFFDNYVIPLAQKLRECGVFGVSCDEFMDYATDNRMEWESKGRDIVRQAAETLGSREDQEQVAPASVLFEL